ncbi:hypothetical protein HYE82_27580 [Streptomyces sp. BR123]|uniref:hypothetical protein n=1 Tax=Streptomyces sp. BR123 TaxID=2749828 RepID=UPI0015C440B4|nr:hypothetical protein [Streptomyces sp. BR123]NXY98068.1 hypothetical protein [Streptomyces sp. BR123]
MPVLPARRRVLLAPLILAATVLYAAATAPAAYADEPDWTAAPAAGGAGSARPAFYLAGVPGTVLEDRLALDNPSGRERTLTLRGADAQDTADGGFTVRPAADPAGGGSWISFGTAATVRIPARTRAVVPFTVTLPPAALPGDHPAAVVAAEAAGREAGVRVHLRVGGPALAALTVEDVSVRGRGTRAEVGYTLVNRGNVPLAPGLSLRAEGLFGAVPGRPHRALPVELLPGQRVRLSEPWPGAPRLDDVDLTLTVTAPGAAPASARASARLVPWGTAARSGAVLLALGGAALAALPLVRSRRRRARRGPPAPGEPARAAGRTADPDHELTGATT